MVFQRKSSIYAQNAQTYSRPDTLQNSSPVPLDSSIRRHVFTKNTPDIGSVAPLTSLFHFGFTLARFRRSFGAGVDDDPTPTGSIGYNFQTADVMNNSRIENFNANIRLTNTNANPITLTAYSVECSFWDAHDQDTIDTGSPLNQSIVTANTRGQVQWKTPTANMMGENVINLSKFRQRVFKKLGDITIGGTGASQPQVVLNINRIPPKVRRMNCGAFWGIAFVNDASKNTYGDFSMGVSCDISFDEIPSSNRPRWLE